MRKRLLYIIIGLICISLSGIIVVQFLWIRNAIRVKEAQFNQSVNEALGMTVNAFETKDNVHFISQKYIGDSLRTVFQSFAKDTLLSWKPKLDSFLNFEEHRPPPPPLSRSRQRPLLSQLPPPQHPVAFSYKFFTAEDLRDMARRNDSILLDMEQNVFADNNNFNLYPLWNENDIRAIDSIMVNQKVIFNNQLMEYHVDMESVPDPPIVHPRDKSNKKALTFNNFHTFSDPGKSSSLKTISEQIRKLNRKAEKVQNVIKKMTMELESEPRPITERLNDKDIRKTLSKNLADKDIRLPFEYAVLSKENPKDSLPVRSVGFKPEYLTTPYRVSLFPNDIFQTQNSLLLFFPGRISQLLASLSWLMIASILFTLVIVFTSGLSIFVMIRQKKISDIKTDFINNMTHEFKTPLATISLAVDSIVNPKVIEQPSLIRNYTKVIKEENNRMNGRVEQVLQMALLESKDFKLSETILDVHELINNVCNRIHLQIEKREGQLTLQLDAERSKIRADGAHLTNVLMTLLDNAIKYSQEKPEIKVSTANEGKEIIISVDDKGIGMTNETRQKIFEKFFRVTSGNIHNVKGFGLGLSYAKAIITAHKGQITVKSEPGKGSRFDITLPVEEEKEIV
jgi:two-component system phosphate regulon sensor histidine kinase PhoR